MKGVKFLNDIDTYNPTDAFVARLSNDMNNKEKLLKAISDKLKFPAYFGLNWDALSECLRDLHWIEQQGVVLIHENIPLLKKEDMRIYICVLIDAVQDWKEGEEHYLEIVFSSQDEVYIKQYLK